SKGLLKDIYKEYNMSTDDFKVVQSYDEAKKYIESVVPPYVIKKDGLSEGKGVVIIECTEEGLKALEQLAVLSDEGDMLEPLLIEEYLQGEEFSLMVMVN